MSHHAATRFGGKVNHLCHCGYALDRAGGGVAWSTCIPELRLCEGKVLEMLPPMKLWGLLVASYLPA